MRGTVKWFDLKKGYGFLTGEDGDYYAHNSDVIPKGIWLREGVRVTFETEVNAKGLRARQIKVLASEPAREEQTDEQADPFPATT